MKGRKRFSFSGYELLAGAMIVLTIPGWLMGIASAEPLVPWALMLAGLTILHRESVARRLVAALGAPAAGAAAKKPAESP